MGIDKQRSRIDKRPFYLVDPDAIIEEGNIACLKEDLAGNIVAALCTATDVPIGVFWKNKATTLTRIIDEEITFVTGGVNDDTKELRHSTVVANKVYSGATTYTEGALNDYTIAGGIITRTAGSTILPGATVHVLYRYNVLLKDTQYIFVDAYNRTPDNTVATGKITVAQDWGIVYTDKYDITVTAGYAVNDALYVDDNGCVTNIDPGLFPGGISPIIGRVVSPPTADKPFLGYEFKSPITVIA